MNLLATVCLQWKIFSRWEVYSMRQVPPVLHEHHSPVVPDEKRIFIISLASAIWICFSLASPASFTKSSSCRSPSCSLTCSRHLISLCFPCMHWDYTQEGINSVAIYSSDYLSGLRTPSIHTWAILGDYHRSTRPLRSFLRTCAFTWGFRVKNDDQSFKDKGGTLCDTAHNHTALNWMCCLMRHQNLLVADRQ